MTIPIVFYHDSTKYLKRANHYESVGHKAADLSPYRDRVEASPGGSSTSGVLVRTAKRKEGGATVSGDQHPSTSPQSIVHPYPFHPRPRRTTSLLLLTVNPLPVQPLFATDSERIPRGNQANGNGTVQRSEDSPQFVAAGSSTRSRKTILRSRGGFPRRPAGTGK